MRYEQQWLLRRHLRRQGVFHPLVSSAEDFYYFQVKLLMSFGIDVFWYFVFLYAIVKQITFYSNMQLYDENMYIFPAVLIQTRENQTLD